MGRRRLSWKKTPNFKSKVISPMKKFILALALVAGSAGIATAQNSAPQQTSTGLSSAEQDRLQFVSYISELDASLGRSNAAMAQQVLTKVQAFMQTHTAALSRRAEAAPDIDTKDELRSRVTEQRTVMAAVKGLSTDPLKNRAALNAQLKDYLKVF